MFASCLTPHQLTRFADLFAVQVVEAGAVIFHQGAVADMFYIVRKGEVSMRFSDKESMMKQDGVEVVGEGGGVGVGAAARLAQGSVEAGKVVKGGKAATQRRANSMQVDGADAASIMETVSPTATAATSARELMGSNRGKGASRASLGNGSHSRFFSYAASGKGGDKGDKGGEKGGVMSPTFSATASASALPALTTQPEDEPAPQRQLLSASSHPSSFALLATKSSGEFFGLEALRIGSHPRTCLCVASVQTALLTLTSAAFHAFVGGVEEVEKRKKLYDLVGDSIQACLQQMPYLSGVSAAKVSLLSSLFVWTTLPSSSILFEEGERSKSGNGLYFLYEGTVGVYCKDDKGQSSLLKELTPGVCFGELGLIIHLPRTATIRAHSHCLLLYLPHRSFHNFLHLTPEILTKFKEQIETYQLNVVYLLENDVVSHFFHQHCQREYSTENLEFWWEAKEYRQRVMGEEERRLEAGRILDTYITDSSPKQINLKGNTQKNILHALRPPPPPPPPASHHHHHTAAHTAATSPLSPSSLSPPHSPPPPPSSHPLSPTTPSSSHTPSSPRHPNPSSSHSPSSPRHHHPPSSPHPHHPPPPPPTPHPVDELLYQEAENEIFNLLATDSFSRFKASPLFKECLEEMHVRVRSASISVGGGGGGGGGVGGDGGGRVGSGGGVGGGVWRVGEGGEGEGSASPSSSMQDGRGSPDASPKSMKGRGGFGAAEEEAKEEDERAVASAVRGKAGTPIVLPSAKRRSGRNQLPSLARSNTMMGVGGAGGGASPRKVAPLRRTATARGMAGKGLELHVLNGKKAGGGAAEEEKEGGGEERGRKEEKEGGAGGARLKLDIPGKEEEDDAQPTPSPSSFSSTSSSTTSSSLRFSHSLTVPQPPADPSNASFAVYLNSRKKVTPTPLLLSPPPLGHALSISLPSSPSSASPSSPNPTRSPSPLPPPDPFSPTAKAAATVAARKKAMNAQLVAKALATSRGSIEVGVDSPRGGGSGVGVGVGERGGGRKEGGFEGELDEEGWSERRRWGVMRGREELRAVS